MSVIARVMVTPIQDAKISLGLIHQRTPMQPMKAG